MARQVQWARSEGVRHGPERAIKEIEKIAEEHPELYTAHYTLAMCHFEQGNMADAEACLRRCLDMYPGNPSALNCLAAVQKRRGDHKGAVVSYLALLDQLPDHPSALLEAGNLLAGSGRTPEAIELYRASLAEDSGRERVRVALADLLFRRQDNAAAALLLVREGLALEPGSHELQNMYAAIVAATTGSAAPALSEAVAMMEQVCAETQHEDHRYLHTLSLLYDRLGRTDEALRIGERAERLAIEADDRRTAASIRQHLARLRALQGRE